MHKVFSVICHATNDQIINQNNPGEPGDQTDERQSKNRSNHRGDTTAGQTDEDEKNTKITYWSDKNGNESNSSI